MKKWIAAALAMTFLSAAALGMAAGAKKKEELLFGYSAPGLGDEGQQNIQEGFTEKAEDMGIETIVTNAERNAAKQVSDVEDLIARGVDAICAVPFSSDVLSEGVKKANEAGIPFFTIDRGVTEGKVVLTVMADNYLAGKVSARNMVRLLEQKYGEPEGKVLEIMGQPGQDVARLRAAGFDDHMQQYKNIKVIAHPGNWNPQRGNEITQDVLTANPDLDGIYYHADLYIPGIVEGIRAVKGEYVPVGEKGHIFILGIDGNPSGLKNVRQGNADGVVVQPLRDYGHIIAPIIVDYIQKGRKALPESGTEITREGERWSPAQVVQEGEQLRILTQTYYVGQEDAYDCSLWGNRNADICK